MNVGDIAPDFTLNDQNGNEFRLYDKLIKNILLVFYPKDNTYVCSAQLKDYNVNIRSLSDSGISLVGINADSIQSHLVFCSRLELSFPLLADIDKIVSRQYAAINIFGQIKRKLVLIGTNRKIIWINNSLPVSFIRSEEILYLVKVAKL